MSTKSPCTQRTQRGLNNTAPGEGVTAEGQKPGREEEEEEVVEEDEEERESGGGRIPSSLCPSCGGEYDVALLLPCSHTMCGRCVSRGSMPPPPPGHIGGRRRRACSAATAAGLPPVPCSVSCPGCHRRRVELPCWGWASAVRCLPLDPTLTPGGEGRSGSSTRERGGDVSVEGVSETGVVNHHAPAEGGIDLQEDEMERSVLGLSFALDPSGLPSSLHLSNSSLTVTFQGRSPPTPTSSHRGGREVKRRSPSGAHDPRVIIASTALPRATADVVITRGQYYWEVDVCNSDVYKVGVTSLDGSGGWWLERRDLSFWAVYDGGREALRAVPPRLKTLGVFLNVGGGALSFSNPLAREHLATLPTRFGPAGVRPALCLGHGKLRLHCGLAPPPHVFVGRTSAYRGPPRGAGGGPWRRDVPFRSVRTAIRRFEELAVSDSGV